MKAILIQGVSKSVPVRLLGTRFEAGNCISEPGPEEPYKDIFFRKISLKQLLFYRVFQNK
jgi:hypothetical protein